MDSQDKFTLKINGEYYNRKKRVFDIKEDSNIKIEFNSDNPNARFYLDLLDIVPKNENIDIKVEKDHFYINPTKNKFYLYKNEEGYTPLFPGQFPFIVVVNGKVFKGRIDISLKLLELDEWNSLKEDLEKEIVGLSREYDRTLVGPNSKQLGPEKLRPYLIIKNNYRRILGALYNIQKNPHYIIKNKAKERVLDYNIQDNKVLKIILNLYEKLLSEFIETIEHSTNEDLNFFKLNAIKLKKVTSLVKGQKWYKEVEEPTSNYIPHSLALDPCYSILYKLYTDLTHNDNIVKFKTNFPWKRTNLIYEMWSYIKLCRELQKLCLDSDLVFQFGEIDLFPFLSSGSKSIFYFDSLKFEVIYDYPIKKNNTTDFPIFTKQSHNRPDIIINIYSTNFLKDETEVFLGSFIVECKYRRFESYWGSYDSNAQKQIYSYKNNIESKELLYEDINDNPIKKVFVLTPDEAVKNIKSDDIIHMCIRNKDTFENIITSILNEAKDLHNRYKRHILNIQKLVIRDN